MVPLTICLHHMMLMPVLVVSYDQESHGMSHFCHLDLKHIIAQFIML